MRAEPEAAGDAAPARDGTAHANATVQQAVEQFVELHSCGRAPDAATFAARHPEPLRARILTQCREFLAFDGLLGHQEWQPEAQKETPGRTFGDFVIQEELGRGGMGVVYLAHQRSLNRRVALKVMASGLTLSKRHVERFRREAAAAAQLHHPAIVAVHALTEVDGTFALAMDYVAGRNLADIVDDLRLSNGDAPAVVDGSLGLAPEKGYVAECAMFVAELASALAAAHQANVVHRDLKPRNLMLDDRRQVRLLDFGLAKSLGEGSISMSGEITGTAHYMSPEQTLAKRVVVDHRTDIWALGVILYEVLTLRRPFDGKNLQQIVYEICFKEPPPPQRLNHKVPRDLATICQKALEKDPNKRYQTAGDLEADLQRFLRWEPVHAKPAGPMTRLLKWTRRHRAESVIATVALVVATGVLGGLWYQQHRDAQLADGELAAAERHEQDGRFVEAVACATRALALRNDEATRARLKAYGEASKNVELEAKQKINASSHLTESDRELAIVVALAAVAQHPSADARSAVLDALGSGCVARTLRSEDEHGKVAGLTAARWSPDGRTAVTAGADGRIAVWDAATGIAIGTLRGHEPDMPITGLAFAGDDRVVTVSHDKTLRIWRLHDQALDRTIALPGGAHTMRASTDGAKVLVVTYGSKTGPFSAQVWSTSTGEPGKPVTHNAMIVTAALSPCGAFAATCGLPGGLRLWRTDDGVTIATIADHQQSRAAVKVVAFAPDSSLLAAGDTDGAVRLYRTADGALLGSVEHSGEVTSLAFDRRGERLLSGSHDLTARLWQLQRRDGDRIAATEVATLVGHTDPVHHVAFDPTDQLAVTGGHDGVLRLFDVTAGRATSGRALYRYEVGTPIDHATFSPDGRAVLGLARKGRAVVWDFGSARGVVTLRQPGRVPAACFDATGGRLVTAGDDERLRLWSAEDGLLLWQSKTLGQPVLGLDVDAAGERIACSTVTDGAVRMHRLADGERLYELRGHRGDVPVVRFQGDGNRLLTAGEGDGSPGLAIVWNTNDQSQVQRLVRPASIVAADLSADGTLLATVEQNERTVRLWHVPTGQARGEVGGHRQRILCVHFAPDGQSVLTAGDDGQARVTSLDGRSSTVVDAGQPLHFAAFSRDGRSILTCAAASSAEAQLWHTADGAEVLRFHGHRETVVQGSFSADGNWAATTARDGTACIWPTDPVATARRLPLRSPTDAERQRYRLPPAAPRDK